VVIVGVGAAWAAWGDRLSLEPIVEREAELRQIRRDHPVLVYGAAFVVYVVVTACSLPVATLLSLAIGWYFGFWRGILLASFASTSGATLAFLMSRYLLRDAFQRRFGERLRAFNAALDREGEFYLFALRLTPAVPFFVINVVMGLTRLRVWTFWWVSQLGMLAATCVFVYTGSEFPDLRTLSERGAAGILSPGLIAAFVLLGVFPLVAKRAMAKLRGTGMRGGSVDEMEAPIVKSQ
jgi:uncharacterized membrane protein YdjX (TVP38/TMEM64 family)